MAGEGGRENLSIAPAGPWTPLLPLRRTATCAAVNRLTIVGSQEWGVKDKDHAPILGGVE